MKCRLLVAVTLLGCSEVAEPPAAAPAVDTAEASVAAASAVPSRVPGTAADAAPAADMNQVRRAMSRSSNNLHMVRRSGRLHVDVAGTFQSATVMTFDADGQTSQHCVDNPVALDRMLGETR